MLGTVIAEADYLLSLGQLACRGAVRAQIEAVLDVDSRHVRQLLRVLVLQEAETVIVRLREPLREVVPKLGVFTLEELLWHLNRFK